jgi:hypothetical protein
LINLRFTGTGSLGTFRCKNKLSKDYRRFPSLLIDEKIVIDPSEDLFEFEESFMLSGITAGIGDVLITHSHLGHFSINAIERLAKKKALRVYAHSTLFESLRGIGGISLVPLSEFTPVRVADYDIIPCPSNHRTDTPGEVAFNFYINREKSFFYGLDGGWLRADTFEILRHAPCSAFVLDCHEGDGGIGPGCVYHNSFSTAMTIRELLISSGAATEGCKFILSHLPSQKKISVHETLTELTREMPDVKIAYDGYYLGL